jgi:hypothetical protein
MTEETTKRICDNATFHIRTKYLNHFRNMRNNPAFDIDKEYLGLGSYSYRDCVHMFHCTDGPAVKTPMMCDWIQNGRRHRTDGPSSTNAQLGWKVEGKVASTSEHLEWRVEGKLHHDDGPAITDLYNHWYDNGKFHCGDEPARTELFNRWYAKGKLHRVDNPAIEYLNGYDEWYLNGKLHRDNGPAITSPGSHTFWYESTKTSYKHSLIENYDLVGDEYYWAQHGKYHRVDGPAVVNSYIRDYYMYGKLHRTDGPAQEIIEGPYKGAYKWYNNGVLHRLNGPAVIIPLTHTYQWWRNGELCTDEEEMESKDEYYHTRLEVFDTYLPIYGCASGWINTRPLLKCISSYMEFEPHGSETHLYKSTIVDDGNGDEIGYDSDEDGDELFRRLELDDDIGEPKADNIFLYYTDEFSSEFDDESDDDES